MSIVLDKGLRGSTCLNRVEEEHTARSIGSGSLNVLATPVLAGLLEKAACDALEPVLESGTTSVGSFLEIRHTAPTPMGMSVSVEAELVEVDGRMLTFRIEAHDDAEQIGSATHQRVLVDEKRFIEKADRKTKQ